MLRTRPPSSQQSAQAQQVQDQKSDFLPTPQMPHQQQFQHKMPQSVYAQGNYDSMSMMSEPAPQSFVGPLSNSSQLKGQNCFHSVYPQPTSFPQQTAQRSHNESLLAEESELISLVMQLPTDQLLTGKHKSLRDGSLNLESLKQKIVNLVQYKDKGILGAFMLYQDDNDFEGFKARVIHKVLTPNSSRETNYPQQNFQSSSQSHSSMYNFPQTAAGSRRRRTPVQQDRYIPIVLDLEHRGMLDEYTAIALKTLILEENFEVCRAINSYQAQVISDKELGFKLARLAQHLSPYHERPQSPLPKRKQELMTYVDQLAHNYFSSADDIQLLQKLIHDENEFILSSFDVFQSDKDHENLIDSLQRILDKSKLMGIHLQSVQASSFFTDQNTAWPPSSQTCAGQYNNGASTLQQPLYPFQANQTRIQQAFLPARPQQQFQFQQDLNRTHGFVRRRPGSPIHPARREPDELSHGQAKYNQRPSSPPALRNGFTRDPSTSNHQQPQMGFTQVQQRGELASRKSDRSCQQQPHRQRMYVTRETYVASGDGFEFKPTTTVHDVALIPNYFSSGEEEAEQLFEGEDHQGERIQFHNHGSAGFGIPYQHGHPHPVQANIYKTPDATNSTTVAQHLGGSLNTRGRGGNTGLNTNINHNYFYRSNSTTQGAASASDEGVGVGVEPQQFSLGIVGGSQVMMVHDDEDEGAPQILIDEPQSSDGPSTGGVSPFIGNEIPHAPQKVPPVGNSQNRYEFSDEQPHSAPKQLILEPHIRAKSAAQRGKRYSEAADQRPRHKSKNSRHRRRLNSSTSSNQVSCCSARNSNCHHVSSSLSEPASSRSRQSCSRSSHSHQSCGPSDSCTSSCKHACYRRKQRRKQRKGSPSRKRNHCRHHHTRHHRTQAHVHARVPAAKSLTRDIIEAVLVEEGIEPAMRQDSFATLRYELQQVPLNRELTRAFQTYLASNNSDSVSLMAQLFQYAEDALQSLHEANFTNEEVHVLHNLRQQRDSGYQKAYLNFTKSGQKQVLIHQLRVSCQEHLQLTSNELQQAQRQRRETSSGLSELEATFCKLGSNLPREQQVLLRRALKYLFESGSFKEGSPESNRLLELIRNDPNSDLANHLLNFYNASNTPKSRSDQSASVLEFIRQQLSFENPTASRKDSFAHLQTKTNDARHESIAVAASGSSCRMQPRTFGSLTQAINSFLLEERLSLSEARQLLELLASECKSLVSIWEAYQFLKDESDMLESLKLVLKVQQQQVAYPPKSSILKIQPIKLPKDTPCVNEKSKNDSAIKIRLNQMAESSSDDSISQKSADDLHTTKQQNAGDTMPVLNLIFGSQGKKNSSAERRRELSPLSMVQKNIQPMQLEIEVATEEQRRQLEQQEMSESELSQINEFQHTILRKYAMTGMISYPDAPVFHNLVEARDYRILCIFEVFSQNRFEDDFLENLALLAQIVKEQEPFDSNAANTDDAAQIETEEPAAESVQISTIHNNRLQSLQPEPIVIRQAKAPSFSSPASTATTTTVTPQQKETSYMLAELSNLRERNSINEDEFLLVKSKLELQSIDTPLDRNLNRIFNAFRSTGDREDLSHSLSRYCKRIGNQVVQIQPPQPPADPFVTELKSLELAGNLSPATVQFCLEQYESADRKLVGIWRAFQRTSDREDFVHTITRYFKRVSKV